MMQTVVSQTLAFGGGEETCVDCIDATIIPDWNEGKRVLAIIHHADATTGEQGLFVYNCTTPVKTGKDLSLERILPIRADFKYDIETRAEDQSIIQVRISTSDTSFVVEVPFETKSSNFFKNLKKFTTGSAEKIKKGIPLQFRWLQKYDAQIKPTGQSTIKATRPNTVADPFGMSAFDSGTTATQYVNTSGHGVQPQRITVSGDTRTQSQGSVKNPNRNQTLPPSYINAPHDPWEGMQPLVQFGSPEEEEAPVAHPQPPTQQGFDSRSQGFEDSFNDVLTLDSSDKGTLTTTQQTTTTGSLSSLSIPSSSSSSSLDQPDANRLMRGHTLIGDLPDDDYDELKPITRNRHAGIRHSGAELDAAGYAEVRPVARFRPAGIREEILKRREKEYTFLHDFRVFVGTWNVNGQAAPDHLMAWLGRDAKSPDMYAIGFQELDLSKEAFLFNDSVREEEWLKSMDQTLHRIGKYLQIKVIRLVGMMLAVYVQERHVPFLSEIMAEQVGTGIMGKMGNKGGVAVRFEFHNTSFCFVNTHLAAHMEEFERRNQDYNDICNRMKFEWELNRTTLSIRQHDVVIWMGDLNYRISSLDLEVVKKLIEKRDFLRLLKHDQLFQQLELQKVFHGFTEGSIGFQPTYKYDPGSDDWDTSEKQRVPAWCDRILFKGNTVKQKFYRSHMELKLSDHKPVSSVFDISVKVVDEKAFKQVVEEEIRKLDRQENESMPQVTLSTNNIDYSKVQFMEPKTQTLDVANTGQVNTEFKFANKLDDKHFCKPFLKVEPSSVFLMPGDSIEVSVTVLVDKYTAASLNSGQDQLEDILVLHLDNGKDYYITVSGTYVPSSFGCSIEALVMMHSPISELTRAQVIALEQNKPLEIKSHEDVDFARFDIPKEVWMLVDHLFRNATKSEYLFQQEGLHDEVLAIKNCLDNGLPDTLPGGIHSVAEALLLFLESLREPVIPHEYYDKCLECCNNYTLCKMVLKKIPKSHRNVFKYLAAFIRELVMNFDENKLDAKTLATVFGEMFLRTPEASRDPNSIKSRTQMHQTARKKASFVYQFIINEYDE